MRTRAHDFQSICTLLYGCCTACKVANLRPSANAEEQSQCVFQLGYYKPGSRFFAMQAFKNINKLLKLSTSNESVETAP